MPRDAACCVRAVVRLRPLLPNEIARGEEPCCEVQDTNTILVRMGAAKQWRQYAFDACLPNDRSQRQAFQESGVTNLLDSAVDGYAGTVLAYGQTGSGKTHTILGRLNQVADASNSTEDVKRDDGLVMRSAKRLFKRINAEGVPSDTTYTVSASFTEIYNAPGAVNECICDLLNPEAGNLQVRYNQKHGFFVSDLKEVPCHSAADVRAVLEVGVQNRRVSATAMNRESSRSHALLTLRIDSERTAAAGEADAVPGTLRRYGKITFVDLAGSERLKESLSEGNARKETQAINKSLFTLGKVISQLAEGKKERHVPYRDSKLTQLLQESFGGGALCLMVTCISPAATYAEESINSLNYAQKAMNIRNRPVVRLDEQQQLVFDLKHENAVLRRELEAYRLRYGMLSPRSGGVAAIDLRPAGACPEMDASARPVCQLADRIDDGEDHPAGAAIEPETLGVDAPCMSADVIGEAATPGGKSLRRARSNQPPTPSREAAPRPRGRSAPPSEAGEPGSARPAPGAPPSAPAPQRAQPPVPASSPGRGAEVVGSYALAMAKRRQADQAPAPRKRAPQGGQGSGKSLPPLPGGRGCARQAEPPADPLAEAFASSRGGTARSGGLPPSTPGKSPHKPRVSGTAAPCGLQRPASSCDQAAPARQAATPPRTSSRSDGDAPVGALGGSGFRRSGSLRPESRLLAASSSADGGLSRLASAQLEHLNGTNWTEWQIDFRRPRHRSDGAGSRSGSALESRVASREGSRCSADRQPVQPSPHDDRDAGLQRVASGGSSSSSSSASSSSSSRSPSGVRACADGGPSGSRVVPDVAPAAGSKAHAGPDVDASARTDGDMQQMAMAELCSKLSSMQHPTSALMHDGFAAAVG